MKDYEVLKKRNEEQIARRNNSIVLERRQVSTNNPAIAQLWVTIPSSLDFNEDLVEYHKQMKLKYTISAPVHTLTKVDDSYVLEIRGVLPMYKWMEFFITSFKRDFKNYSVVDTGKWEKYEE